MTQQFWCYHVPLCVLEIARNCSKTLLEFSQYWNIVLPLPFLCDDAYLRLRIVVPRMFEVHPSVLEPQKKNMNGAVCVSFVLVIMANQSDNKFRDLGRK